MTQDNDKRYVNDMPVDANVSQQVAVQPPKPITPIGYDPNATNGFGERKEQPRLLTPEQMQIKIPESTPSKPAADEQPEEDWYDKITREATESLAEDKRKEKKRSAARESIASIGDMGRAIANLVATVEYAPDGYDAKTNIAPKYRERYDKAIADLEKNYALYMAYIDRAKKNADGKQAAGLQAAKNALEAAKLQRELDKDRADAERKEREMQQKQDELEERKRHNKEQERNDQGANDARRYAAQVGAEAKKGQDTKGWKVWDGSKTHDLPVNQEQRKQLLGAINDLLPQEYKSTDLDNLATIERKMGEFLNKKSLGPYAMGARYDILDIIYGTAYGTKVPRNRPWVSSKSKTYGGGYQPRSGEQLTSIGDARPAQQQTASAQTQTKQPKAKIQTTNRI